MAQFGITITKASNPISKEIFLDIFRNNTRNSLIEESYFDIYSEIFTQEAIVPENFAPIVSIDINDVFVTSLPTPKPIKPVEKPVKKKVYISKSPFVSSGYADSPTLRVWFYLDEKDNIQGPFTSIEMDAWFEMGYLFNELLIRFKEHNDFIKLIDLFGKTETQLITIQKSNVEKDFPSPSPNKQIDSTLNSSEKNVSPTKSRVFNFIMPKEETIVQDENLLSPNPNIKSDSNIKASPEKVIAEQRTSKPVASPAKVETVVKTEAAPTSSSTAGKKPRPTFNFKMDQTDKPKQEVPVEKEKTPNTKKSEVQNDSPNKNPRQNFTFKAEETEKPKQEGEKEQVRTPILRRNDGTSNTTTPNKNPKQAFSFKADDTEKVKQENSEKEKSTTIKRSDIPSSNITPGKTQKQAFTFKSEDEKSKQDVNEKPVEVNQESKQIHSENSKNEKKTKKAGKEGEKKNEKKKKAHKEILYVPKSKPKSPKNKGDENRKASFEVSSNGNLEAQDEKIKNNTDKTQPRVQIIPADDRNDQDSNGDEESPRSNEDSLRENSEIYSVDSRTTHDSNLVDIEKAHDLISAFPFIIPKRKSSEAIEPPSVSKKIEKAKTTEDKGFSIFGPTLPQDITNAFKTNYKNGILDSDDDDFNKKLNKDFKYMDDFSKA